MEVTDEMLQAALQSWDACGVTLNVERMRAALEAALAAAPEPGWVEELAAEWEREGERLKRTDDEPDPEPAWFADELRARAKGAR